MLQSVHLAHSDHCACLILLGVETEDVATPTAPKPAQLRPEATEVEPLEVAVDRGCLALEVYMKDRGLTEVGVVSTSLISIVVEYLVFSLLPRQSLLRSSQANRSTVFVVFPSCSYF